MFLHAMFFCWSKKKVAFTSYQICLHLEINIFVCTGLTRMKYKHKKKVKILTDNDGYEVSMVAMSSLHQHTIHHERYDF